MERNIYKTKYIHVWSYMYIYIHAKQMHTSMSIYVHMHMRIHVHIICIYIHTHACKYLVCICAHYVHICPYMYVFGLHICMCICMSICMYEIFILNPVATCFIWLFFSRGMNWYSSLNSLLCNLQPAPCPKSCPWAHKLSALGLDTHTWPTSLHKVLVIQWWPHASTIPVLSPHD